MGTIKLDGAFIQPLLALQWDSCEKHLKRIAELEKSWIKDLKPLLGAVVPYDAAAKRVVDGLS